VHRRANIGWVNGDIEMRYTQINHGLKPGYIVGYASPTRSQDIFYNCLLAVSVAWNNPYICCMGLPWYLRYKAGNVSHCQPKQHSHFQRILCTPSDIFTLISSWPPRRTVSGLLRDVSRCRIDLYPTDRYQLNNYLQEKFKNQTTLTWKVEQLGEKDQRHESPWEAIAFSPFFLPRQFSDSERF
jgi:hypothetical protein